jgi:hypothetical protein
MVRKFSIKLMTESYNDVNRFDILRKTEIKKRNYSTNASCSWNDNGGKYVVRKGRNRSSSFLLSVVHNDKTRMMVR